MSAGQVLLTVILISGFKQQNRGSHHLMTCLKNQNNQSWSISMQPEKADTYYYLLLGPSIEPKASRWALIPLPAKCLDKATRCGPCQYMVPVLEDVSRRMKDKIRVVKIDTEKYPSIASRYGVQALPTFILFRNGQPFDRLEGAIPADQLISRIEKLLQVAK